MAGIRAEVDCLIGLFEWFFVDWALFKIWLDLQYSRGVRNWNANERGFILSIQDGFSGLEERRIVIETFLFRRSEIHARH